MRHANHRAHRTEIGPPRGTRGPGEIASPREILSRRGVLLRRAIVAPLALALAAACSADAGSAGDTSAAGQGYGGAEAASSPAAVPVDPAGPGGDAPVAFTEADLDAYERGRAREIELVLAARERGRAATTPEERAAASQAEWEDATMPEAARSAGMDEERYRRLRGTVDEVLETLDFQGKIDGPLSVDTARAGPELRARLTADPYAALPPASAAALRARLPRLSELWAQYMELTAVGG